MALSKEQIREVVSTDGTKTLDKESSPAAISSLRSRLWQAAKRNDKKVSCSIEGEKFVVVVTPKG